MFFSSYRKDSELATRLSFKLCESMAENGKPFSDGEIIKNCLTIFTEYACPEKKHLVEQTSLSRFTVSHRTNGLYCLTQNKWSLLSHTEQMVFTVSHRTNGLYCLTQNKWSLLSHTEQMVFAVSHRTNGLYCLTQNKWSLLSHTEQMVFQIILKKL